MQWYNALQGTPNFKKAVHLAIHPPFALSYLRFRLLFSKSYAFSLSVSFNMQNLYYDWKLLSYSYEKIHGFLLFFNIFSLCIISIFFMYNREFSLSQCVWEVGILKKKWKICFIIYITEPYVYFTISFGRKNFVTSFLVQILFELSEELY